VRENLKSFFAKTDRPGERFQMPTYRKKVRENLKKVFNKKKGRLGICCAALLLSPLTVP
jgi:hypothetical protein